MKKGDWKFKGGSISTHSFGSRCEECDSEGQPIYSCSWGGGWEYEPAELCRGCIEAAISQLQNIVTQL